ncbi:WD40 repeat domain-containing protein [Suttonella sp. R2A3]|uniref:WD40 repeat domain-containing protein n=1 Tax=Suttonella sp. R2A3 TaxID=2908648 RepID=UPI001F36FB1E|nr:WD40 repeat domain-containing protein [Suttonella sp. R2A3]UJF23787.1 WD40 repeat domain-containing protein [Suttonella sp. R2A3]
MLRFAAFSGILAIAPRGYAANKIAYYEPSRYAFVTDVLHHRFSVADIVSGQSVGSIALPALPKVLASSKDSPYLAFSDRIASRVWLLQQKSQAMTHYDLPSPVYKLFFLPSSTLLVIALEAQVALLDYASGTLKILPGTFQSRYAHFSTIISPVSQTLTVLEERSSNIQRWDIERGDAWQAISIGGKAGFAHGVPGFADALIAFTTYQRKEVIFYTPETESIKRFPSPDNTRFLEPYLSNDLSFAAFANLGGYLHLRRLGKHPREHSVQLDFTPRYLRSGWLDRYLVIGGDGYLQIRDAKTLIILDTIDLDGASIISIWVSGDSKYALFTYGGSATLGVYNLQTLSRAPDITLPSIMQPNRITMNSTNNICF